MPGAIGRFAGFWSVLIQAAFSYIGTEITAIAAGEAKNPRKASTEKKKVKVRTVLGSDGKVEEEIVGKADA